MSGGLGNARALQVVKMGIDISLSYVRYVRSSRPSCTADQRNKRNQAMYSTATHTTAKPTASAMVDVLQRADIDASLLRGE
jgi:hypothetical protein